MRKTIFVIFILLGFAVGVFSAINESVGLKILLGGIGAVAGAAIGGALAAIGCRRGLSHTQFNEADGLVAVQDEQARNYWLDRGRLTSSPGLPHPDDNDPRSHER
ncbi:MAG: hypothetical protein Q7K57_45965 [Burkholderiaceae bacterium]|nr:hypothetical protein [Burkholderiaceae bacterium]